MLYLDYTQVVYHAETLTAYSSTLGFADSKSDGFTRWANRIYEISTFIKENGYYPKAGKDKAQSNLYQSLARTKRAYLSNELSEKQFELLKELKINLD